MTEAEIGDTLVCEAITVDGKETIRREVVDLDDDRIYFENGENSETFIRREALQIGLWEVEEESAT